MFASVTSVSIAVLTVVTPPTIANVAPPPPPLLTGAFAVETSGIAGGQRSILDKVCCLL
jgi:hypothetical protein